MTLWDVEQYARLCERPAGGADAKASNFEDDHFEPGLWNLKIVGLQFRDIDSNGKTLLEYRLGHEDGRRLTHVRWLSSQAGTQWAWEELERATGILPWEKPVDALAVEFAKAVGTWVQVKVAFKPNANDPHAKPWKNHSIQGPGTTPPPSTTQSASGTISTGPKPLSAEADIPF